MERKQEIPITIWLEDPRIERDGDFFIAYADGLKLLGCGLTEIEAVESLTDAIKVSFMALDERGILFKTLDKRGIPYEEEIIRKTTDNRPLKPFLMGVSPR